LTAHVIEHLAHLPRWDREKRLVGIAYAPDRPEAIGCRRGRFGLICPTRVSPHRANAASPKPALVPGRMGPVADEEPASGQIGHKASEMAGQIELTARDLARVAQEATALAGALARKVASVAGIHPEAADGPEISRQAHDLAGAIQETTSDALRIAERAVEMASKIAHAPSVGSGTTPGEDPAK